MLKRNIIKLIYYGVIISIVVSVLISSIIGHASLNNKKHSENRITLSHSISKPDTAVNNVNLAFVEPEINPIPATNMNLRTEDIGANEKFEGKVLTVKPDHWFFKKVVKDSSAETEFVLKNIGIDTFGVTVPIGIIDVNFYIPGPDTNYKEFDLAPGDSKKIAVVFRPSNTGFIQDTCFTVVNESDNAKLKKVYLTGFAVSSSSGEMGFTVDYFDWDYGIVPTDSERTKKFILENKNFDSLDIHLSFEIKEGNEKPFEFVNTSDTSFKLLKNSVREVEVSFKPKSLGLKIGFLKIDYKYENESRSPIMVFLKGIGGESMITITPSLLDFKQVAQGSNKIDSITINNLGEKNTLKVFLLALEDPGPPYSMDSTIFSFVDYQKGDSLGISPGTSRCIKIKFSPDNEATLHRNLVIFDNDPDPEKQVIRIPLYGTGVKPDTGKQHVGIIQSFYNYPNPFENHSKTTLVYKLSANLVVATVSINIYDISGNLVRELIKNRPPDQFNSIDWDGKDFRGSSLANGVYIGELIAVTENGKEERRYHKIAILNKKN